MRLTRLYTSNILQRGGGGALVSRPDRAHSDHADARGAETKVAVRLRSAIMARDADGVKRLAPSLTEQDLNSQDPGAERTARRHAYPLGFALRPVTGHRQVKESVFTHKHACVVRELVAARADPDARNLRDDAYSPLEVALVHW